MHTRALTRSTRRLLILSRLISKFNPVLDQCFNHAREYDEEIDSQQNYWVCLEQLEEEKNSVVNRERVLSENAIIRADFREQLHSHNSAAIMFYPQRAARQISEISYVGYVCVFFFLQMTKKVLMRSCELCKAIFFSLSQHSRPPTSDNKR